MTNTEIKLRGMYNDLSNTERKIADYFLADVDCIFNLPIADLAKDSNVSQVAWVRFCKSLGYSGLKEMKKVLFSELNGSSTSKDATYEFADIKNFTNIDQICDSVRMSSIQSIDDSIQILDKSVLNKIVDLLITAKSVQIFGVGASGLVGTDLYYKLIRIGKHALFDRDIHIQLTYAATLTKRDVAIFISNSGLTDEVLDLLRVAKKSSAKIISITKFSKNPLATACDYALYTSSPEADKRSGAMCSRIAQLALIDILFTAIANKNYDAIENALEDSYKACSSHRSKAH